MLKRLIAVLIIFLLLFLFLAKRGASAQNLAVTNAPPAEGSILLLNLPDVYILPSSPLYFLVEAWEQVRLLLTSDPSQRSSLLLSLAEARITSVVKMLNTKKLVKAPEPETARAIKSYQTYLEQAGQLLNLVQEPGARGQLRFELEKHRQNLKLFKDFLAKAGISVNWEVLIP